MEIQLIGNDTELDRKLNEDFFSPFRNGYVEVGPAKMCMPACYKEFCERIKKFEVRDDDVYIIAFPKSGTRWTNEMVWLIMNDLNYEKSKQEFTDLRIPRLEQDGLNTMKFPFFKSLGEIDTMESPRCIGSHLHWTLLPDDIVNNVKNPKIIVTLRSPLDVCLSFYYENQTVTDYSKSLGEFCEMFLGERIPQGPYWAQTLSLWEQRHRSNIMFIKYKEMKEDMVSVIKKVAKFLEKDISDDKAKTLAEYLSFDNLKQIETFSLNETFNKYNKKNSFVRKGVVGGYKTEMSDEIQKKFKLRMKELYETTKLNFE